MSTPKQTAANRRNAQCSTGPRSAAGKAASRANSLKTGLYARSQIISGEDPAELRALADRYFLRWEPATPEESFLVSTLIDSDWLLRRYSLADAQIWDHEADNEYVLESPHPKGLNFIRCREYFPLLQRRSDSAQRTWHRALRDLERLQAKRPAPTLPAEKPDSGPPPKSKPNSAQPQSVQQRIGFVPPFSPAPDPPLPEPPTTSADPQSPEPQPLEASTNCPDEASHPPVGEAHNPARHIPPGGADPLVRGRRPRRPVRIAPDSDSRATAGPGGPARSVPSAVRPGTLLQPPPI